MEQVTSKSLEIFLQKLGERTAKPASLYILGGSALIMLGSSRETVDVDYATATPDQDFESIIKQLADESRLDLENVPLKEFIPIPVGAEHRHRFIGKYGKVDVYIFDPYSIALSKLDRGFDTDIDDIVFLIRRGLVTMPELEKIVQDALPLARKFDMDPMEVQTHLQVVKNAL